MMWIIVQFILFLQTMSDVCAQDFLISEIQALLYLYGSSN